MLELENQFLALKKVSMSDDEYTNAFTDKMKFSMWVVTDELTKINKYAKGFPWDYTMLVKQEPTFQAAVYATKSMEEMI